MEFLSELLGTVAYLCVPAFIFFWWKKRKARLAAGENYQNDPTYQWNSKIKRKIGIAFFVTFILGAVLAPGSNEKLFKSLEGEEKIFYDTKFNAYIAEGKNEDEAKDLALEDVRNKRDEERKAKEAEEKKLAEEKAAQEKLAAEEKAAQEKLAKEEKANQEKLAAEEKANQEKLAKEQKKAQEEQEKIAKAKEQLAKWEQSGKLKYQHLPDGSVNVILTDQADYKLHGASEGDKLQLLTHDEHERNALRLASQSMVLVQEVKAAGIKVNNFEVHLKGDLIDSEGYKSVGDVMICEISGNRGWEHNDYYGFYNSTSRFWMVDGL